MTGTSTSDHQLPMIDVDGANPELCEIVRQTLAGEGVSAGRVDMHFVDLEEITALNVQHLGGSGPTDVLSFPIDGIPSPNKTDVTEHGVGTIAEHADEFGGRHIGEIVICEEVAKAQAAGHMGNFDAEMTLLTIHASLHLCGYDHHDDDERHEMWAREAFHLERYQLTHPGDQL